MDGTTINHYILSLKYYLSLMAGTYSIYIYILYTHTHNLLMSEYNLGRYNLLKIRKQLKATVKPFQLYWINKIIHGCVQSIAGYSDKMSLQSNYSSVINVFQNNDLTQAKFKG